MASTNPIWNTQQNFISERSGNPFASVAIGKAQFTSVDFNGKMEVRTTGDNDIIGFVFGFQDDRNFYVVYARKTGNNLPWRLVQVESTNLANLAVGMEFIAYEKHCTE